jgi:hypothetical protein
VTKWDTQKTNPFFQVDGIIPSLPVKVFVFPKLPSIAIKKSVDISITIWHHPFMNLSEIQQLKVGDKVWWNDPDDGLCSRWYEIAEIEIVGDIVSIIEPDGTHLSCFFEELSLQEPII